MPQEVPDRFRRADGVAVPHSAVYLRDERGLDIVVELGQLDDGKLKRAHAARAMESISRRAAFAACQQRRRLAASHGLHHARPGQRSTGSTGASQRVHVRTAVASRASRSSWARECSSIASRIAWRCAPVIVATPRRGGGGLAEDHRLRMMVDRDHRGEHAHATTAGGLAPRRGQACGGPQASRDRPEPGLARI